MVGFLCTTPYHLLLSLFMASQNFKNDEKVLVIFKRFKNTDSLHRKIRESNVFKEIVILDSHDFDKWKNWNRRLRMFFFYKGFKTLCRDVKFDQFIFFAPDLLEVSFMIELISEKNPRCSFAFAEDGIGSYFNPGIYMPTDKMNKWLCILRRKKYLRKIKTMYLLKPNLLAYPSEYEIKQILPYPKNDAIFDSLITSLWGNYNLDDYSFLFLQQPFSEDGNIKLGQEQDRILEFIMRQDFFKSDNIGVKLHPRSKNYFFPKGCSIIPPDRMYEIGIKNSNKITCLMGINSGALLTPFLLWGKVFPIIFLYRLCNIDSLNKYMDALLNLFKLDFEQNGGKLFIPSTYEELLNVLKMVLRDSNDD